MTPEQLATRLNTLEGFGTIIKPFLFFFGGPKKSFAVWQAASAKAVYATHTLRADEHDDTHYRVLAFSTRGPIAPATLETLRARAAALDLGTIRYECLAYTALEPWRGVKGSLTAEASEIISLGDPDAGLFVFPAATENEEYPLSLYALVNGEHHVYPVRASRLN